MEQLSTLLEALLMSLAVIGAAALDMLLLIWIIFAFFIVAILIRFAAWAIWNGIRDGYKKAVKR